MSQKFTLFAGGFVTTHDTVIRLDATNGVGTSLSLEDDLGLDATTNLFRAGGSWRFAERHRAHFGFFDLSQSGTRNLDRELVIEDFVYSPGESVVTDWKMRLFELGYSYRLKGSERFEWWFNFAFFIQDTALVVEETESGADQASEDLVLPLPKLGTVLDYAFTDRWVGHLGIDVFAIEIGDVGARLVDARATIDYRFTDRFSLGAGFHDIHVAVKLDRSVSGWQGRFDWETTGWMLYGRLSW